MNENSHVNVLVVEDHVFQQDYICSCLRQIGIQHIVTASDGYEALHCIDERYHSNDSIELIVCDLKMPNMDGIAFMRYLAERQFVGYLIILTAMDSSIISSVSQMAKKYQIKLLGSLHKPVDKLLLNSLMGKMHYKKDLPSDDGLPDGVVESDLIHALNNEGLFAYFQPKFSFSDESVVGLEALARLVLPNGQVVLPEHFLHLYDRLDNAKSFELTVYRQAFELLRYLINQRIPIRLSVNYSASMLDNFEFYDSFVALAEEYNIPPQSITIELTEKNIIKDPKLAIELLSRFRVNGFNLSVDDFGTGYSSFKQLELLPFNELKVDKSFIVGIEFDAQKQAIVESTVELAHRLDLDIVAEGIETRAAWDMVKAYGFDVCQGFLTGKPLSKGDAILLLEKADK